MFSFFSSPSPPKPQFEGSLRTGNSIRNTSGISRAARNLSRGDTLFMKALELGNFKRIELLINEGGVSQEEIDLALALASQKGRLETVHFLLEHGANVNAATTMGMTALMSASFRGDLEIVRTLVDGGANVNAVTTMGYTALMWASGGGHLETVRFLVERGGANVNAATTTNGMTALMMASVEGHLETVRFLVERAGAAVDAVDLTGMSALMLASRYGHLEIVRFLVERGGANVNPLAVVAPSVQARGVPLFNSLPGSQLVPPSQLVKNNMRNAGKPGEQSDERKETLAEVLPAVAPVSPLLNRARTRIKAKSLPQLKTSDGGRRRTRSRRMRKKKSNRSPR